MSFDITCRRCGEEGLAWKEVQNKYHLIMSSGVCHNCSGSTNTTPITTRAEVTEYVGNAKSQPMSAGIKTMAQAAVLDAVAEVRGTFDRVLSDASKETEAHIHRTVDIATNGINMELNRAYDDAVAKLDALLPQVHEIHVTTPIGALDLEGRPHRQLQELVDWLSIREHVWASGPAGSGKTYAAEQAAVILGLPSHILPCGMSTNDWSLLGFKNPDGKYIPGHMRQPYEHGGVFILDEIDNTPASVMTTINSALSGSHYLFPDGDVQRHPDFRVVGCANTWGHGANRVYVGRNQLDAATLDRFKGKMNWQYDEEAEFDWAGRDQNLWVEYVQRVRKQADEQAMRVVVSPRASISGANALRNGFDPDRVTESCLWLGMSDDDSTRLKDIVGKFNVPRVAASTGHIGYIMGVDMAKAVS